MASNFDKLEFVKRRVRIELGDVVTDIEQKNFPEILNAACLRYYTAQPIQKSKRLVANAGSNTVIVNDITDGLFGVNASKYYWLGICYSYYGLQGEEALNINNSMNPFAVLAAVQLGTLQIGGGSRGGCIGDARSAYVDPLSRMLQVYQRDSILGEELYDYDHVTGTLSIIAPADGAVSAAMAYGYKGDPADKTDGPLRGVPYAYLDIVARLVAEEFAQSVIMTNGIVKLAESDFEIDIALLKEVKDRLEKMNNEDLSRITVPYILFA